MTPHCCLAAIGLLLMAVVPPAFGQTSRPERPYRGLFGSGLGDSEQSLTANASLAAGYDDNILAHGVRNPRSERKGVLGQGAGGLNYSFDGDRVHLGATAATSARYYPTLHHFIRSDMGSLGGTVRVLNSPAVTIHQMVAYHPYSFRSLLNGFGEPGIGAAPEPGIGQLDTPDLDTWITPTHYLGYTGGITLNQKLSRRGSLDANYNYRFRHATGNENELLNHHAGAGYSLSLSKGLSFKLGYGYRVGRYLPNAHRIENHNIDVGLDYSRSLSFSRRTTVSFSTGTNAVNLAGSRTDLETSATTSHDRTRFHATGTAHLVREIGRTWAASAEYSRGLRYSDAMEEPIYGDSAALGLGGLLSRRLQFQSSARGLFRGRSLTGDDRKHFDLYLGTAALSYGLTRYVSFGLNYSYFRYRFDGNVPFPTDIASNIGRQSVRASVNLWAPLFNRERSANVTR